jgi:hypothetical protein
MANGFRFRSGTIALSMGTQTVKSGVKGKDGMLACERGV